MVIDSRATRLTELRQERARVLLEINLRPPMIPEWDALVVQYSQLDEAVLTLSAELGEA